MPAALRRAGLPPRCWGPASKAAGAAPAAPGASMRQHYHPGSLVLETVFDQGDGEAALIDFMPLRRNGTPHGTRSDVIRIVRGLRGTVRMRMDLTLRFDYGATVPWVTRLAHEPGLQAVAGPDMVILRTPIPLQGRGWPPLANSPSRPADVPFLFTCSPSHWPCPSRSMRCASLNGRIAGGSAGPTAVRSAESGRNPSVVRCSRSRR